MNMTSGGLLSVAKLVTGVVRIKVVALALGVTGVGIYAILLQLYVTSAAIVSMSLGVPIINLGRRPLVDGNFAEAGTIAGTALVIVAVNFVALALFATLFGETLFGQLGISGQAQGLLVPIVIAILVTAFSSSFWEGLSYLCDRFDIYVRVGIIGAVVDMLFVAAGASADGLRGAVFALPVGPIAMFAAYAIFLKRDSNGQRLLARLSVRLSQLPRLLSYSMLMFASVALTNVSLTIVRSKVLLEAGPAANGYLQTTTSLAAYILAFVTTGFWGHMHARAAAAGDTDEVRVQLDRALRLGLLISFTGCGLAVVLADYLIPLFYSGQFRGAVRLMIAYMPGEFCYQFLTLLVAYQLTISRRRRYLVWSLGYIGLLTIISYIAIPHLGAAGFVLAHVIASFVMVLLVAFICWRTSQLDTSLVGLAALLAVLLALISAGLYALHLRGTPGWWVAIAIIPACITGAIVLRHLVADALTLHSRKGLTQQSGPIAS